jgi:methionyl-tRNA formyltransferase
MQNKNTDKINFVFWGTPDIASETLEILKQNGFIPSLIVTSPDAKSGRGLHMQASPVAVFAEKNNIPCLKPEKLDKEELSVALRTLSQADEPRRAIFQQENKSGEQSNIQFFLVVAYGKIIPENVLNIPKYGSINIHYSLLPKYRGASPVESAILNGDVETGVTIQHMEFKMDSGPIIAEERINILPDEKAPELRERLIKLGGELLVKILPDLVEGKIKATPQDESQATFCKKIKKENGLIDLNGDPIKNYNKFRAYYHWPRIFFFQNSKRIIVTNAELENNKFIVKRIIPEGGKEIKWEEFNRNSGV